MVTLLRTLTYNSQLKFGTYYQSTVKELLAKKESNYLVWCYYNLEKITFERSILKDIGITGDCIISKPGKDKELGRRLSNKKVDWVKKKKRRIETIKRQSKKVLKEMKDDGNFSKAGLARKNQGH